MAKDLFDVDLYQKHFIRKSFTKKQLLQREAAKDSGYELFLVFWVY